MATAILVTGGAGYIGAHVCKALAVAGYLPVTLDNLSSGQRDFVRWGPLIEANIKDADIVRRAIAQHQITAVIDLAGRIEVGESVKHPLAFYENNVAARIAFLHVVQQCGINAYVFSSSAAVYGEPLAPLIKETHPLAPSNPYGWTKLIGEQLLSDCQFAGGPKWIALRYFNAAGASQDAEIGEAHEPETHLIPLACQAALGLAPPLRIFGQDYQTPDGTAIRDYVHVEDLAAAHVLALQSLLGGGDCGAYNLGSGTGTSVADVLAAFANMGLPVPHNFRARRAGDPARLVADVTLARQALKWQATHKTIESIIRSAYNWHKRPALQRMEQN